MNRGASVVWKARRHWGEARGKAFIAISAGWFLSIGVRNTYPVLLPFLRTEYDLSLTSAGLLITVLWLAYSIGQVPGGVLGDRFGEGITMAASMAIAATTITLIVSSESVQLLFLGTGLLGVSVALFGVVRLTSTADLYPKRVGTVHGFLGSVGGVGNTVLPPLIGFTAAVTAWRYGFSVFIPVFILVAVMLWAFVPNRTSPPPRSSGTFNVTTIRSVMSELRHRPLVLATLIMMLGLPITQAFVGFYPTYLIEVKGLSAPTANGLFALFFALGVFIKPLAGNSYDHVGIRRSLVVVIGISAVGFVLLPFAEGLLSLVVVTAVIAAMNGRGTVTLAYLTISLSAEVQNMGLGVLRTLFFLLGALSPVAFGAIADRGYFNEAYFLLAGLSGITLLVVLKLPSLSAVDPSTPGE